MQLPAMMHIQLVSGSSGPAQLSNILVVLDVRYLGAYYFGTVLGLTDADGHLEVGPSSVEQHFAENQRFFPMDYRVSLAQCDPQIAVRALGGLEFEVAQAAAETNALMSDEVRASWRGARNLQLASSGIEIDLREHSSHEIFIHLPVSPLRASPLSN